MEYITCKLVDREHQIFGDIELAIEIIEVPGGRERWMGEIRAWPESVGLSPADRFWLLLLDGRTFDGIALPGFDFDMEFEQRDSSDPLWPEFGSWNTPPGVGLIV